MNKSISVLVVDDEPDIVEFLSYNLNKSHYNVFKAYNGVEGLKSAEENHPDLILMDIRMPVMNGLEMCKELRKKDSLKNILVIFLSADRSEFTAKSAFEAGGNHFVTKPITPSILMNMINELMAV